MAIGREGGLEMRLGVILAADEANLPSANATEP